MRSKRVVVLGAGFAGLAAAYRLGRNGHDVTVLETQPRVGGRALALGPPLAEGLLAETGPARFPPEFRRVIRLAGQLGLDVTPFYPEEGTVVAYLRGRRIDAYEPSPEEFWGYTNLRKRYPGRAERRALRAALSARSLLRRLRGRLPWKTYRIRGGTQELARALARASGARIRVGATVECVETHRESVSVRFTEADDPEWLEAEYVVCALPLSMLARMHFSPGLSAARAELISAIPFSSALRIFVQMRGPYWRDHGHNGFAVTDTLGEVWDPHFDEPREPALLVCYAQGELAEELADLGEAERVEYAVTELEAVFPGAARHFETGVSFCWRDQPWIRGGWPLVRSGFENRIGVFREPDGRVLFAGDYAADPRWLNMMEGAIESGEHAARLIERA